MFAIKIVRLEHNRWELHATKGIRTSVALAWDSHDRKDLAGMLEELAKCIRAYGWKVTDVSFTEKA